MRFSTNSLRHRRRFGVVAGVETLRLSTTMSGHRRGVFDSQRQCFNVTTSNATTTKKFKIEDAIEKQLNRDSIKCLNRSNIGAINELPSWNQRTWCFVLLVVMATIVPRTFADFVPSTFNDRWTVGTTSTTTSTTTTSTTTSTMTMTDPFSRVGRESEELKGGAKEEGKGGGGAESFEKKRQEERGEVKAENDSKGILAEERRRSEIKIPVGQRLLDKSPSRDKAKEKRREDKFRQENDLRQEELLVKENNSRQENEFQKMIELERDATSFSTVEVDNQENYGLTKAEDPNKKNSHGMVSNDAREKWRVSGRPMGNSLNVGNGSSRVARGLRRKSSASLSSSRRRGRGSRIVSGRESSSKLEQGASNPLTCGPCYQIYCAVKRASKLKCKGGKTLGICNCCPVCAKVEGEACGGQHDYLGRCDVGSLCVTRAALVAQRMTGARFDFGAREAEEARRRGGVCQRVDDKLSRDQPKIPKKCLPKCTVDFCGRKPTAVCSARDVALTTRSCQGSCQHTSCRACFFEAEAECPKCAKDDVACIRRFGRCKKRDRCTRRKFPCKGKPNKYEEKGKFICEVPHCK